MYDKLLKETENISKEETKESEVAKEQGNSVNESFDDIEDGLSELEDALSTTIEIARQVAAAAEIKGGEVARVVAGQIESYLIGHLQSFRDEEKQPGSVASLRRFLEDEVDSGEGEEEEEYDEQEAIRRGETPLEGKIRKTSVKETDGETLQYRKDQLARLKMNPDTNYTPAIKISDNYVSATNYLSITAAEFEAIKDILEKGVGESIGETEEFIPIKVMKTSKDGWMIQGASHATQDRVFKSREEAAEYAKELEKETQKLKAPRPYKIVNIESESVKEAVLPMQYWENEDGDEFQVIGVEDGEVEIEASVGNDKMKVAMRDFLRHYKRV